MHGLNALFTVGNVLYFGISDTPAWIVVKANEYAKANGLRGFSVYQGKWNMGCRDLEREVLPMCRDQGMGVVPWGGVGGSKYRTTERREGDGGSGEGRKVPLSENDVRLSGAIEGMARRKGVEFHALCLAYLLHKAPYVFPLAGQRRVDHLLANVTALSIKSAPEEIRELETVIPFDVGFPMNFLFGGHAGVNYSTELTAADVYWTTRTTWIDVPPPQRPIEPRRQ